MKTRRAVLTTAVLALSLCMPACSRDGAETEFSSPFPETTTFAVAPVLNFSGAFELDPVTLADLLASELSYVDGISVLPVSRVVAFLAVQGKMQIESPAHARAVAEAVGADVILVAGITEYDAYTPVVGLVMQMYTVPEQASEGLDPVLASRRAQGGVISETADPPAPTGQIQEVFNGSHADVVRAVRRYAKDRCEGRNPLGWRQYLKVQTWFLRFCWHEAVGQMLAQQRDSQALLAAGPDREDSE